ncbi:putative transcription factor interactor and regulator CCHC(Zn) family [Arabidopsis thaliana]
MTSNLAESVNALLKQNREYPIVCLFESIRSIMTRWFNERREESSQHPSAVTINVGKKMNASYDTSTRWLEVCQVNQEEFEVKGDTKTHLVNLDKRTCTCCMFDIDKFPCAHGIASAKHINLNENMFVDEFHSTYRWRQAYSESIHPNGDMEYWEIPETISEVICLPPSTRVPSGRRKKKRIPSVWEHGRSQPKPKLHKCSRCGQSGHNKSTCVAAI